MTQDETPAQPPDSDVVEPRRRKRARRVGLWVVLCFAVAAFGLLITAWSFLGKPVTVPEWMQAEIETRIEAQMPGTDVSFSNLTLFVSPDLRPEVSLSNLELLDTQTGRVLIEVANARVTISRRSLYERQVRPRTIDMSGLFLTLRREVDGQFDLAFGGLSGGAGTDMPQVIAALDRAALDPRFSSLENVSVDAVTLAYQDARAGRAWTVDGGRLNLSRNQDLLRLRGDFALLSGRSEAATLEVNAESRIGSPQLNVGVSVADVAASDIASQSPALAWLRVLRAPISGALRAAFLEDGALGPLSATLQIDEGVLQPIDATRPIPFSSAKTYFTYDPQRALLQFDEISLVSEWVQASGSGRATLETKGTGLPDGLSGQISLTGISANPDGIYETSRALNAADAAFHMGLDPFVLRIGRLSLRDGEDPVTLSGRIGATDEGWEVSVMAQMDEITPERLLSYWPATLIGKTRNWIETNVYGGVMRNVSVAITADAGQVPDVYLGAELDQAEVRFMKTLPPATQARGVLQLHQNRLTISVDEGRVEAGEGGTLQAAGTVFVVPDVRIKDAPAQVQLRAEGPVKAGLWLLNQDPLNALDKAGRSIHIADGQLRAEGNIDLRLKKKLQTDEVRYDIAGTLLNVKSTVLVPGKVLAAQQLRFAADNDGLRISGDGTVDNIPFDGAWQTALGKAAAKKPGSELTASVTLNQAALDAFNVTLPRGSVSGQGRGTLNVKLRKGEAPRFTLTSDLAGLGLRMDALGWSMSRKAKGALKVEGALETPAKIDRISLDAPGLDMTGKLVLQPGGGFRALRIERLRVGKWLDAPVVLTGQGRNAPPAVSLTGGRIDLRNAPFSTSGTSSGGAAAAGGPMKLALDRLQVSDGIVLTNFRGDFAGGSRLSGDFTARVNGRTPVRGNVRPSRNGAQFRIRSDDAGGVLRDAGLLKNVSGGDLTLKLKPTGATGTFDGELSIDRTRIRRAPVMAELLNAISIVGLLEQLGGQGIAFQEVDAKFRLTPKQVILTQSSAIGPSMGISLDGYYNLASGKMDMQGVLSPIYVVNVVGRLFARRGEGLIGFNFNLRGKAEDPKVVVNPLSALTPGMFREIFRRPPPKLSQ